MARPAAVGRENWANYPKTTGCTCLDGTCERHTGRLPQKPSRGTSLEDVRPDVASRLVSTLTGWTAADVSSRSSTALAVWNCPTGLHTFCATPFDVMKAFDAEGSGCGICAGKVVRPETSLASLAPWLAEEWLAPANQLAPTEVSPQSNSLFWWQCSLARDHVWAASANNRYGKGSGCPFCKASGARASSTNNVTLLPALMSLWDAKRNNKEKCYPQQFTIGSTRSVWWKCPQGQHESEKRPISKQLQRSRCSGCAGHKVTHTNSLASKAPRLVEQLDVIATGRTAEEISCGENGKVHWICPAFPESHRWQASPLNRVTGGTGCPDCMTPGLSAQEVRIAFELAQNLDFDPTVHSIRRSKVRSVDMVAPDLRLVMEFDGSYWHEGRESEDEVKSAILRDAGWTVVRIRESPLKPIDPKFDVVVPYLGAPYDVALRVLEHLTTIPGKRTRALISDGTVRHYRLRGIPVAAQEAEAHLLHLRSKRA